MANMEYNLLDKRVFDTSHDGEESCHHWHHIKASLFALFLHSGYNGEGIQTAHISIHHIPCQCWKIPSQYGVCSLHWTAHMSVHHIPHECWKIPSRYGVCSLYWRSLIPHSFQGLSSTFPHALSFQFCPIILATLSSYYILLHFIQGQSLFLLSLSCIPSSPLTPCFPVHSIQRWQRSKKDKNLRDYQTHKDQIEGPESLTSALSQYTHLLLKKRKQLQAHMWN